MKKLTVLLVATFLSCPALILAADAAPKGGNAEAAGSTVKSSKSNSSDRTGAAAVDSATTVKSGKSNTSERAGAAAAAADSATTVKSGKSNSSD